jgi:hypothetical protein
MAMILTHDEKETKEKNQQNVDKKSKILDWFQIKTKKYELI